MDLIVPTREGITKPTLQDPSAAPRPDGPSDEEEQGLGDRPTGPTGPSETPRGTPSVFGPSPWTWGWTSTVSDDPRERVR